MNEKDQPSPEQLLKMLDLQLENARNARASKHQSRTPMRIYSIAIILGVMILALWILMSVLEEMRPAKAAPRAVPTQGH